MQNKPKSIKILATLGPASMTKGIVAKMDASGVDIFRVNLSHTNDDDFPGIAKTISTWTSKPLCIDSEGAQIRTGKMRGGKVQIAPNSIISLVPANAPGTEHELPLYPIDPASVFRPGDLLYIDFDSVIVQVTTVDGPNVLARVLSAGIVGSNKGVAVDRDIDLPAFTDKDLRVFGMATELKLDHVALSFAKSREDVEALRALFPYPIFLISKIESKLALTNLKEIAGASDAILIDRGDLSRDVPMQKIGLAQRHILDTARALHAPVYVATNLLESMVEGGRPTRAEINDITSTALSGASGLVLAAETAIGKYPVESVRMVSGIIREVEYYGKNKRNIGSYLSAIHSYSLVEPHGGVLVQGFAAPALSAKAADLPRVDVDDETLSDIVQIGEGVYSPLRGFMNRAVLESVLADYRLPGGVVWPLPVLFQMKRDEISFKKGWVGIGRRKDERLYAAMKVSGIEEIDIGSIAKQWFGTDDMNHPGVARFVKRGDVIVSGEVFIIAKPAVDFQSYVLTPRQSRRIFGDFGWRTIVGFHTRNVIHRGHEFIQKKAMDLVNADALLISPVVGSKKEEDFSAKAIIRSYEVMLESNLYAPYSMILGAFDTYSRFSGPREAVFTALCRKNFGCSHFIVGRDHTGVGSYYAPDASQKLFTQLGDIGIQPLVFDAAAFCTVCDRVTDDCGHESNRMTLSGTQVRNHLISKRPVPEYLMRKEVSDMLLTWRGTDSDALFEKAK